MQIGRQSAHASDLSLAGTFWPRQEEALGQAQAAVQFLYLGAQQEGG
jgi:hypothetical protein